VVTKAGSAIIATALPGQEAGNPGLVAKYGAGMVATGERGVVAVLRLLRDDPARLAALAEGCRRLARLEAGRDVAGAVLARLAGAGEW
jgi:hypothetical protein